MKEEDIVQLFFRSLNEVFQNSLGHSFHNGPDRSLLFEIEEMRYMITIAGTENDKKSFVEVDHSKKTTDCTLSLKKKSMVDMCLSRIKPMGLFLNGSLKLSGDRKVLFSIMSQIKLASEMTRASYELQSSAESILDVHVLGTIEVPGEDQLCTFSPIQQNIFAYPTENDVVDKTYVKYVVEVVNLVGKYSWNVPR